MQHRIGGVRDRREDGISEVVGFVIILAVLMAGLSLYLTYAVPVQGREEEIAVMDGVRSWFVDYKTGMDQIWMNSAAVPNNSSSYVPLEPTPVNDRRALYSISSGQVILRKVINPGTARESGFIRRYMPVLAPIPASAEISIRTGDSLTITGWRNATDPEPVIDRTFDAPALTYTSHNYYWLQQEYSYQLGAVFLRQWDLLGYEPVKTTVVLAPPLSIYPPEGGTDYQTKAGIVVVNLNASTGGFGVTSPVRVETNLSADPLVLEPNDVLESNGPLLSPEFSNITLTFEGTSHESAMAWYKIFKGAATRNTPGQTPRYCNVSQPPDGVNTATIEIVGYEGVNPTTKDVQFEALVADYSMRLENVPTMIE